MQVPARVRPARLGFLLPLLMAAGLLGATATLSAWQRQARAPVVDLTADGVARAASKYVAAYQKEFSFLVADETYIQRLVEDGTPVRSRRITGELFMTYLPVDGEWITVHDVAEVDGRPITSREEIRRILQTGDFAGVVERVANHNARFNIGTIIRNFNEPTLPLLILDGKRVDSIKFKRKAVEGDGAETIVTLQYEEDKRPTLVSSAAGGPVYSKGEFVIEAATGRVRQTTFELKDGRVTARLVTTYQPDEKLDLWVPSTFAEQYELDHRSGKREVVFGEAQYTNYRRFQATGRIKK